MSNGEGLKGDKRDHFYLAVSAKAKLDIAGNALKGAKDDLCIALGAGHAASKATLEAYRAASLALEQVFDAIDKIR